MEELGDPPHFKPQSEAEYRRLTAAGKRIVDELTDYDGRYNKLLAERGGRIAYGLYRIRHKLGVLPGINLVTNSEQSREERIRYHESRRADSKGVFHDEDLGFTEEQIDNQRLLR